MNRPLRIALLGGGQLGRMFIENALRYNVEVHVLDPDPQCPCAWLAHRYMQGRFDDPATVLRFAADADVVGIEIEHVSADALQALEQQGKKVIPASATLRTIQDKGLQKKFYEDHGIPSAPYALVQDSSEVDRHGHLLPGMLKTLTGGYDGKGVLAIHAAADIPSYFQGPYVLEKQIGIKQELAVIAVRDKEGNTVAYDPVEMVFDPALNLVDVLRAPARCSATITEQAKQLGIRVANAFGGAGVYAIEMFVTQEDQFLVNETAPRAHNSGHFTIEACPSSQFDQLLRLYMGWPLGVARMHGPAAMVNLVGEGGTGHPQMQGTAEILGLPGTFIHLYGKEQTRTGRKMGHVTILGQSEQDVDVAVGIVKQHGKVIPSREKESIG